MRHIVFSVLQAHMRKGFTYFLGVISARVWSYLQIDWHLSDNMHLAIREARRHFGKAFFMEVLITACWHIWKIKNGKIFQHQRPSFARWRGNFIHDMTLLGHRINKKHLHKSQHDALDLQPPLAVLAILAFV